MPQMSPMLWLWLYIYMLMMFSLFISIIYFMVIYKMQLKFFKNFNTIKYSFMW